jgi:hypothetical protein
MKNHAPANALHGTRQEAVFWASFAPSELLVY